MKGREHLGKIGFDGRMTLNGSQGNRIWWRVLDSCGSG